MIKGILKIIESIHTNTLGGVLLVIGVALLMLLALAIKIGFIALVIFLLKWILIDGLAFSEIWDKFF